MQPSLLENIPGRSMAQASRDAWDRILPTLTERELLVCRAIATYLHVTGHQDVTGGELADWAALPTTSVRPRLTGAHDKGYVTRTVTTRRSRVAFESTAHAYSLAVPVEAIERAMKEAR